MRVVMVTNNALEDKIGGLERYVRELSATLSRRGIQVVLVAKRRSPESPAREICPDGVTIARFRVPSKRNPAYGPLFPAYMARGILNAVGRSRPGTVVHAHMGLQALPLALTRRRYVFTFHAPVWRELLEERQGSYLLPKPVQQGAVRALRRTERTAAEGAHTTVVLSEFMRRELAILDETAARRAILLPGGIDGERFHPALEGPTDRAAGDRDPVLFTARRLIPRTGVDELILAMQEICRSRPGASLKIAGTGGMEHELRDLTRRLGLQQNVEFLGRISDQELVSWYREASLVVLPTRHLEGFGLTTAEALACGAAVIGTPAGATPELLNPIDPALVTEDISARAIAAAVLDLLSKPQLLCEIRERASRQVLPEMTWERVADKYLELYGPLV